MDLQPPPTLPIDTLQVGAFHSGDALTVVLKGSAEMRDSSPLAEVLLHYHREVSRVGARTVSVDLRQVDFMNSSALNAFVRWFAELRGAAAYQVRLLSDSKKRWQRGSLNALATFAVGRVTVES